MSVLDKINKLFSRCKNLYIKIRRKYARPVEYFAYPIHTTTEKAFKQKSTLLKPFIAVDPAVGKDSAFIVEGFVNSDSQIFIGKFYELNKEKDMNQPGSIIPAQQEEKAEVQTPIKNFEDEFSDAISTLYGSLGRLRNLSQEINNFVESVEQKFLKPGN